ncbi:MAG: DUF5688 family protein [Butyrivibrio sp.]|nr:DUF5688 family protein [Butyrivibrio sp.]
MKKEQFIDEVRNAVALHYGEEAVVSVHEQMKNNGVKYTGLCVKKIDSNIGPTVYIDAFYESFKSGRNFAEIVSEIIKIVEDNTPKEMVSMDFFRDYKEVRNQICYKLVGKSRNEELLKDIPHRDYLDMAIVYYVSMEVAGILGSVLVNNEHMKLWGVDEEALFNAASENTPAINPVNTVPMGEMLYNLSGGNPVFGDEDYYEGMFVSSNVRGTNGACCILYPGYLQSIAAEFGCGFFILPASVHEVIILRENIMAANAMCLADMVRSVNSECLQEQDILSDSVYYYDFGGENNVKKVEYDKEAMVL